MAYRSAVYDSTGITPARTIFSNNLRLSGDPKFRSVPSLAAYGVNYVDQLSNELDEIHMFVRGKIRITNDRYDTQANNKGIEDGQLVWFYNPQRRKGLSPKLQPTTLHHLQKDK